MTTLPSNLYSRDPLEILIEEESRTCKGCANDRSEMVFGKILFSCAIKRSRKNSKCYVETFGTTCQGGK